jgi:hypothetical protein
MDWEMPAPCIKPTNVRASAGMIRPGTAASEGSIGRGSESGI